MKKFVAKNINFLRFHSTILPAKISYLINVLLGSVLFVSFGNTKAQSSGTNTKVSGSNMFYYAQRDHTFSDPSFSIPPTTDSDNLSKSKNPAVGFNTDLNLAEHVKTELSQSQKERIKESLANRSVGFRKNMGQWNKDLLYRGQSDFGAVHFLKDGMKFIINREAENKQPEKHSLAKFGPGSIEYLVWSMGFKGMNNDVQIISEQMHESKTNYLVGDDFSKHTLNAPDYEILTYKNLYDKVDLRYYRSDKKLKYDFVIDHKGDVDNIQLSFSGIRSLKISENGNLKIETAWGVLEDRAPSSYQMINGVKTEVDIRYNLIDNLTFGFKIHGNYDPDQQLIIDPVILDVATFVLGAFVSGNDYLFGFDMDPAGNMYATGHYADFLPVTAGAYDTSYNGTFSNTGGDAWIAKFDPTGSNLIYCTYIGGSGYDVGNDITVNNAQEVFLTGNTNGNNTAGGANFPTTPGAFDVTYGGGTFVYDGFYTKLNSAGTTLLYSTYLGGNTDDQGLGIGFNSANEVVVSGSTKGNFPTVNAYDAAFGGGVDGYVVKFNAAGTVLYSTYLGNAGDQYANSAKINNAGEVYVTGSTSTNSFPTIAGSYDITFGGTVDAFVTKFNSAGNALVYSTFLGGTGSEDGTDLVINGAGEAFVIGCTNGGFPTLNAYDASFNGGLADFFVSKLNSTGTTLIYSTYIGGNGNELFPTTSWGEGPTLVINSCDEVFAAGFSSSTDFPTTSCAYDKTYSGGGWDIVVFKLSYTGSVLLYSSFFGGNGLDYYIASIGIANDNRIGVGFTSHSTDLPTTPGAFSRNGNTGGDCPFIFTMSASDIKTDFNYSTGTCNQVNFTDASNGSCVWQSSWSPIGWLWDFGDGTTSTQQNPSHTYNAPGYYNVRLIVGCPKDTITKKIFIPSPGSAYAGPDVIICSGDNVQLNASGGTSYTWTPSSGLNNPNIANPIATPVTTTKYVVTVGGATCNVTDTVKVIVVSSVTANAGPDVNFCQGDSVQLNASGGNTYLWSPSTGLSNPNIANPKAAPGTTTTYTVTVSSGSCSATDQVVVTRNTMPVANAGPDQTICLGGSIQLTASGGTTYHWSPPLFLNNPNVANPTASPTVTFKYEVKVSNGACFAYDMVNITVIPPQTGSAGPDAVICRGQGTNLNATVGTTFTWTPTTGLSNPNIVNPVASPTITTDYIVRISNGNPTFPCSGADVTGTLGTTAPSGTSPYAGTATDYRMQLLYRAADLKTAGITAGKLKSIAFYVTTKNSTQPYSGYTIKMGCTSATTLGFSWITGLTTVMGPVNYSSALGWNTHTLTTPYNWDGTSNIIVEICWDNSTVSAADVVAGFSSGFGSVAYASNATNAESGCTIAAVGGSTLSHPSTRFTYCKGVPQFSWSPAAGLNNASISNPIAAPATTTTYTVTVTGLSGCTKTDVVTVQVNSCGCVLSAQANVIANVTCNGGNNGSASVTISNGSGPYTYKWSNGSSGVTTGTTLTQVGLSQGTYTVSITEGACTSISIVSITQPGPITVTSSLSAAACNGTAVVTATGGAGVLTYNWSNGATGQTVSGLAPGTSYTITVTDANACTATAVIMINAPANFSTSSTNISCSVSGSASVSVSSGTSPYSFTWSNGATSATVSGLAAGNYTVSVTEGNGCVTTKTFSIAGTSAASATFSNPSACVGSGVTFTNTGTTGTYSWNIGSPINVSGTTV
ncbi:MAG: PKD domain-containing protein, partial [Bacteroidetes bacterium]|nr:PKD domain-containing protein [Bacteroidota bacterium]